MNCERCAKSFSCLRSFQNHFQSKSHKIRIDNTLKLWKCGCGRAFSQSSSLYRHKNKCDYVECTINTEPIRKNETLENVSEVQTLRKENQEMREEVDKLKKQVDGMDDLKKQVDGMDDLRKQVEALLGKSSKNTTTNGNIKTQNNIENQNVHIVVNSFGHENIEHLTDQIICKLIKTAPFTSVPQLIEKIHFDPDHPENHNIKITNKKLNYAEIVRGNKWVTANKKKVIDDVIQKSYDLLDEKYSENKEDISEKRQERFQNFQEKYEQADEELIRNIKNDVDLLLINGTN
jgi:hypothetical protein